MSPPPAPSRIEAYIGSFPEDVQERLRAVREAVRAAAPGATETLKYGMPTFVSHGNLVHFGAFKHHIGFYPVPAEFAGELAGYAQGRGSVRFPYDRPLPLEVIARIVKFRIAQNFARTNARRSRLG